MDAVNERDAKAVRICLLQKTSIDQTDTDAVQKICIDLINANKTKDELDQVMDVLDALVGFRGFDEEKKSAIPSFVFDFDDKGQLLLTKLFLVNDAKPKIAYADRDFALLAAKDEIKAYKHGTKAGKPYFYTDNDFKHKGPTWDINGLFFDNKNRVVCRTIVRKFVDEINAAAAGVKNIVMKEFLGTMCSLKTATDKFQGKYETLEKKSNEEVPTVQFDFDQFGALVWSLAKSLDKDSARAFPLTTLHFDDESSGHDMMLYLHKDASGTLTISVYDPNCTSNMMHIERLADDETHILQLGFHDFVPDANLEKYCGDSRTLSIGGVTKNFATSNAGKFVDDATRFSSIGDALATGNAKHIEAIAKYCKTNRIDIARAIMPYFEKLKGGFFIAMQDNHAKAITALGPLLKGAGFSEEFLADFFSGKSKDNPDYSALRRAMQNNSAAAIAACGKLIEITGFQNKSKLFKFFTDKSIDGSRPLYVGMQQNSANAIAVFFELVRKAKLAEDKLIDVFASTFERTSNGFSCSALYAGMALNSLDAITVFVKAVKNAKIKNIEALNELIDARDSEGVSAIGIANTQGYVDAIEIHAQLKNEKSSCVVS